MSMRDALDTFLAEPDDERRYEALAAYVLEEPSRARHVATAACDDPSPERRAIAVDVLGQVTTVDRGAAAAVARLLLDRLEQEQDAHVLASLVAALGHAAQPVGLPSVLRLAGHPDAQVRAAVAFALPSLGLDDPALAALRALTADPNDEVRDWATFALAESDAKDVATVAALAARTDDQDDDTRAEAIYGLARRHDQRAMALIQGELDRPSHGKLIEDARDRLG